MTDRSLSSLFGPGSPLSHEARLADCVLLELLANPAADRAGALAEIARRYGRLIWCVCHRSLREPADAEDAFQATLVALLENPAAARKARSLPAWLYGVSLRIGLKLKRREGRQRARDAKSARPESTLPVADSAWGAAAQALDEEVARLPASLRTAYLACESADASHAELAARLGWNAGTLSARYSRARRQLEAKLTARNLALGLAGVGVLATVKTTSAVPWALADSVIRFAQTPVPMATVAPAVLLLAKEGIVMGLSKLKLAALSGVAAVGVGLNVGPLVLPPVEAQAAPVAALGGEGVALPKPVAPPAVAAEAVAGQWEYEFAELPADLAGVKALLTAKGKAGWEYAGTISGTDEAKKPGGAPGREGGKGGRGGRGGALGQPGEPGQPGQLGGEGRPGASGLPGGAGMSSGGRGGFGAPGGSAGPGGGERAPNGFSGWEGPTGFGPATKTVAVFKRPGGRSVPSVMSFSTGAMPPRKPAHELGKPDVAGIGEKRPDDETRTTREAPGTPRPQHFRPRADKSLEAPKVELRPSPAQPAAATPTESLVVKLKFVKPSDMARVLELIIQDKGWTVGELHSNDARNDFSIVGPKGEVTKLLPLIEALDAAQSGRVDAAKPKPAALGDVIIPVPEAALSSPDLTKLLDKITANSAGGGNLAFGNPTFTKLNYTFAGGKLVLLGVDDATATRVKDLCKELFGDAKPVARPSAKP